MTKKTATTTKKKPGKGGTGQTVKSPKPAQLKGSDTRLIRNLNSGAVGAGANRRLPPAQRKARKENIRLANEANNAKLNRNVMRQQFIRGRKTALGVGCAPTLSVYLFSKAKVPTRGVGAGGWICGLDNAIRFREHKYSNQENEFRAFIEGAEVTPYVTGGISWTIESTGGMNTARFVLNNNEDIFIITPQNVCAGPYNRAGWRVQGSGHGKSTRVYDAVSRQNFRVDEAAKWKIYKTKYEIVAPETEDAQIDSYTGMWLYPLNPYSCIFNRNDVVRIFVRLPHVGLKQRKNYKDTPTLWMPAFTGFIKEYNWNDDPVTGSRVVNITCYDFRGLMDRMRVRVNPPPDKAPGTSTQKNGKPTQKNKKGANTKTGNKASESSRLKGNYLQPAEALGKRFAKRFSGTYKAYSALVTKLGQASIVDAFVFANEALLMDATLDDLYALMLAKRLLLGGGTGKPTAKGCQGTRGSVDLGKGRFLQEGSGYDGECGRAALADIDGVLKPRALTITRATAKLVNDFGILYELIGSLQQVKRVPYTTSGGVITLRVEVNEFEGKGAQERKASSVKGTLTKVQNFLDVSVLTSITVALRNIVTYALFSKLGSLELAYKWAKKAEASKKALGGLDQRIDNIMNKSALLKREYGKANRVVTISESQGALLKVNIANTRVALSRYRATLVCLKKEYADPAKVKCHDNQTGPRASTAIADEIAMIRSVILTTEKQVKSMERKRADVGVGKGKSVYTNLKFTYPSLAALADQVETLIPHDMFRQEATVYPEAYRILVDTRIPQFVKRSLDAWRANISAGKQGADDWANRVRDDITAQTQAINAIFEKVSAERRALEKILRDKKYKNLLTVKGIQQVKGVRIAIRATTAAGKKSAATAQTIAEVKTKYAHFEVKQAGIFADLVTTVTKQQPHPLMGKSFEMAVNYLCCEQTKITRGITVGISSYGQKVDRKKVQAKDNDPSVLPKGDTKMDQFNRVVLFGVIGRPMTYQEVSAVGRSTVSDLGDDFSPFNVFYHMLRPASGTSPATIIQQQTGQTGMNSPSVNYETRRKLLDDICSILDYQFYISGWGDLIFEMPNYNAFPGDYGIVFRDAYTLLKEWKTASIAEEAQEVPTAWVITGLEPEAAHQKTTSKQIPKHEFRKIVIMAPILARRLGVRVQHVNLRIPGIGAPVMAATGSNLRSSPAQALDQLEVYGFFYIQRQLGRAHTVSASLPFRPYIVPNRPIWLVHRQRVGLVQNVTHTMNPPNGECTTDVSLAYTRWLHRDGSFRFMAGGQRQPIDYTSFFTGIQGYTPTEGVRKGKGNGKSIGRAGTGPGCRALSARALQASAFSSAVTGSFGPEFRVPSDSTGGKGSPPKASAIDTVNSGLRKQGASSVPGKPQKKLSTGPDSAKGGGSPFHDPWKYLDPRNKKFQSFYVRKALSKYYGHPKKYRNNLDASHSGWDIIAPVGTEMYAPIDILKMNVSMGVGPLTGATNYAYIHKSNLGGEDKFRAGGTIGEFVRIYADQYILWRALSDKYGKKMPTRSEKGGGGMYISSWGYYTNDKINKTGKVYTYFVHVHCADLASTKVDGKLQAYGLNIKKSSDPNKPLLRKGEVIGYVGTTGTREPHLHLGMEFHTGSASSTEDVLLMKSVLAENKRFIDGVNLARAVGWQFDGTDPTNSIVQDKKVLGYWQWRVSRSSAFKRLRRKGGKKAQVTAADVVKWYQRRKKYKKFTFNEKSKAGAKILVNAALYFLPEELVDINGTRRRQSAKTRFGKMYHKIHDQQRSTSLTRTMRGQDECGWFAKETAKQAKANLKNCAVISKRQAAMGIGSADRLKIYKECLKGPTLLLKLAKSPGWAYQKWVRRSVNKRLDAIAKRSLTQSRLLALSKKNDLGLAFVSLPRNKVK